MAPILLMAAYGAHAAIAEKAAEKTGVEIRRLTIVGGVEQREHGMNGLAQRSRLWSVLNRESRNAKCPSNGPSHRPGYRSIWPDGAGSPARLRGPARRF
jgi:hypothetical protein